MRSDIVPTRFAVAVLTVMISGRCLFADSPSVVSPAPTRFGASIEFFSGLWHHDSHALAVAAIDLASSEITFELKPHLAAKMQAALPAVIPESLRGNYTDQPDLTDVNPDHFAADPTDDRPVYFVNGIATTKPEAIADAEALSRQIKRPVQLLYNPPVVQVGLLINRDEQITIDLAMCAYQRSWPFQPHSEPILPQKDPVTRQLTWLLVHSKGNLSIVTHSQGSLIMRNSLLTASRFGDDKLPSRIRWIATGVPLRDEEIYPLPAKLQIISNPDDPVPQWLGLRFDPDQFDPQTLASHRFVQGYVGQIKIEQQ